MNKTCMPYLRYLSYLSYLSYVKSGPNIAKRLW